MGISTSRTGVLLTGWPGERVPTLAWGQAVARVTGGKRRTCCKGEVFPEENQVQVWPCQCVNSSPVVSCVVAEGKSLSDFWASALFLVFLMYSSWRKGTQREFPALCVRRGREREPGHWQQQSCCICGSPIQLGPPAAYFCINKLSTKAAYSKPEPAKNKLHYLQRRAAFPFTIPAAVWDRLV